MTESEIIQEANKFDSAIQNGDTEYVKKCLDSLNTLVLNRTHDGMTGLHIACMYGQLDVVKLLVNHQQINLNVKTTPGDGPMEVHTWSYNFLPYYKTYM